jgi:hypothetical protein
MLKVFKNTEVKITTCRIKVPQTNRKDAHLGGREVYNDDGLTAGSSDVNRVTAMASGDVF